MRRYRPSGDLARHACKIARQSRAATPELASAPARNKAVANHPCKGLWFLTTRGWVITRRFTSVVSLIIPLSQSRLSNRGLLRMRRERPSRCRAAEQRDELASPHSITSSARASSVGGTVRPSAFAVFRLMTSRGGAQDACVLSQQTFRPHGFLHLRPCTDSSHVCLDVRPFCEIDLVDIGPVEHRAR